MSPEVHHDVFVVLCIAVAIFTVISGVMPSVIQDYLTGITTTLLVEYAGRILFNPTVQTDNTAQKLKKVRDL